ncbi:TetR/AcrR family transcriptional regulator [Lipingzhangella sp. LS1_29]|uniref:TetR/AcrR family transcriptional regulator n=1 Tax=Lipingzhangella rawalii TaxID=2055835 RepID=A0ABU2H9V2_9ACTN|nr:TetR/AcrR family transcriptional regulator [Lipingzhangella rawalii]MDS1271787.1 TetR/AcrR family transcriptional regulator [Lipingzhangella rawalii]
MSPQQRRADLIRTALDVFSRTSPDQVTMEDIATTADVSRALIYRYFPNMAELRAAAVNVAMRELAQRLVPDANLPLLEQLRAALGEFIAFAEEYAPAYISLLRGGSIVATEQTEAEIDQVRAQVRRLLLERSGVDEPSARLDLALRCWTAVVESAVLMWLEERSMSRAELQSWLLDQLLAMAGASGAGDAETRTLVRGIVPDSHE